MKKKKRLNHLLFMDGFKLYSSNDNETDSQVKLGQIESRNVYNLDCMQSKYMQQWNAIWI